jgi:hypothetical protein
MARVGRVRPAQGAEQERDQHQPAWNFFDGSLYLHILPPFILGSWHVFRTISTERGRGLRDGRPGVEQPGTDGRCAPAAKGHTVLEPAIALMKSRRLMSAPRPEQTL